MQFASEEYSLRASACCNAKGFNRGVELHYHPWNCVFDQMTKAFSFLVWGLIAFFAMEACVNPCCAEDSPSFRQDIVPILTANGCSSGGCHGKLAGQNGFRLSLRGYAPEMDYESITKELDGRRINFAVPAESLLLQKPCGLVPHDGGNKLIVGSRAYNTILNWIAHRAPGPDANESDCDRIEIQPGDKTLEVGQSQQLLVMAYYPDGHSRDVTWLSQLFSNDDTVISITREGLAKSIRPGATSIRAHFQGNVGVVTFTTPYSNQVDRAQFKAANNVVDQYVFRKLSLLNLPPSKLCDDAAFIRRAYLDATGTLPSAEEVTKFLSDTATDKRAKLIDVLLNQAEFVDYWTLQLCDLLQNRKERDHDVRGPKNVRAFQSWVRQQVATNQPWDQIARAVLTSQGDARTQPQIGYFIYNIGEKQNVEESDIGDSVAMAFLGTRVGCARCHNHPLEKYTQDDYYHFAAYFSRVMLKRKEPQAGTTVLFIGSRDAEELKKQIAESESKLAELQKSASGKTGDEAKKAAAKIDEQDKRLADLHKRMDQQVARMPTVNQPRTGKPMAPQALDGTPVDWKPGEDPREKLVAWMVSPKNNYFSGSMVNRLWKHFMGVGMVEPVDDLRSSNPPSNRELFNALNSEFVAHHFDLKHVMRLIMNSRAYQLSAETTTANEADRQFYSHYYARRLPAEVLNDAISQVTGVADAFPGYPLGTRAVQLAEPSVNSYFLTLFGRSDRVTACACERSEDVTLPQLLHLGNGEDIAQKLKAGDGRLARLLKEQKDDRKVTDTLFLSTLSHEPTQEQWQIVQKSLAAGDPREEVYRDLLWALLNSKEFAFNQ
jgi:hypothetical protein